MNQVIQHLTQILWPSDHKWWNWFAWLTFISLIGICIYRAATLSMTHDESSTWLYANGKFIPATLFDREAWGTANNHVLNGIAIEINTYLFGQSDLIVRLQSIFAFIIYGISSLFLIHRIYESWGAMLLAFGLIFFNVYLIDFFSLARGYGLSVGFQMTAIAFMFQWIKEEKQKYLWLMYLCLSLAALSLFTNLILIPVFTTAIWIEEVRKKYINDKSIPWFIVVVPVVTSLVISFLVYIPITTLSKNSEFLWGTQDFVRSFEILINDSLQGRHYFGDHSSIILLLVIIAFFLLGTVFLFKNKKEGPVYKSSFHFTILSTLIILIIALITSKLIFGTLYPVNRKSTIYFPLLFLIIPYGIEWMRNKKKSLTIGIILASTLFIHFQDKLEMDKTREWYYDYKTKDYIAAIADDSQENEVHVGNHWSFHWTSLYYIRTKMHSNLTLTKYQVEPDTLFPQDYYLIHHKDYPTFERFYKVMEGPNSGGAVLLKKRKGGGEY